MDVILSPAPVSFPGLIFRHTHLCALVTIATFVFLLSPVASHAPALLRLTVTCRTCVHCLRLSIALLFSTTPTPALAHARVAASWGAAGVVSIDHVMLSLLMPPPVLWEGFAMPGMQDSGP